MKCQSCGNEITEQHSKLRKFCKTCREEKNREYQKLAHRRQVAKKKAEFEQLRKEIRLLKGAKSAYKSKVRKLRKVVRALEETLISKE